MSEPRISMPRLNSAGVTLLALIAGLLAQSAGIVWWGAHIDQRMTQVEQKVLGYQDAAALLARLDERTNSLVTTVNRIDARQNAQDDFRPARKP